MIKMKYKLYIVFLIVIALSIMFSFLISKAACEIRLAEVSSSSCLEIDPPVGLEEMISRETESDVKLPVQFLTLVENKSTLNSLFFLQDNSSFGYYDLQLEMKIDGTIYKMKRREIPWYRNIPAYDEVPPKCILARPVSLNPYEWEGFPKQYMNLLMDVAMGKQGADDVLIRVSLKNGFVKTDSQYIRIKPLVIHSNWLHVRYLEK